MAISLGAALLGSALIGGVGSVIGASKQAKGANQATQITAADNAANRAFQENIYNRNAGYIAPWQQGGVVANNAIMELLGYPQATPQPSAFAAAPGYGGQVYNGGFTGQGRMGNIPRTISDGWSPDSMTYAPQGQMPAPVQGGVTTTAPSARSAFDTYRGSTGYDFRVNEGIRALQSAFSRNLESGASSKAAMRFGQGIASDEFARYMGYLTGQSQMGLSGASALAGVGQNFGNNVVAGNQSAASAAANARLYAGNASANMWSGLGSSFGNILGAFAK